VGPNDLTLATYQKAIDTYAANTPAEISLDMVEFLDAIVHHVPSGHILELGSGLGREADYHGLRVEHTDQVDNTWPHVLCTSAV
jgi:hypothetical protein